FAPAAVLAAGLQVHVKDASGQPVADAVVYAESATAQTLSKPAAGVEIQQKDRKFLPLVTVIQTGNQVLFPNNDSVRHHIYSFSPAKKFEQKLYSGSAAAPVVFDKAGVVVLGCNIHDKMLAYVYVVDTPYFGKTDASGKFRLEQLPAGKYSVKVAHYHTVSSGAVAEQSVQVKGDGDVLHYKLSLKPEVKARPADYDYEYTR
ncbi:MAG: hypothetical protein RL748_2318, partial [Pseudomonadota bacterium]